MSAVVSEQCDEAERRVRNFQAPFVALPAKTFVELGKLIPHETLRRDNKLTFVDSVKDEFFQTRVSVFVSHQWLGRDHPDPENIQYDDGGVVVRAVFTEVVGARRHRRRLVAGEGRRARGAPVEALRRR